MLLERTGREPHGKFMPSPHLLAFCPVKGATQETERPQTAQTLLTKKGDAGGNKQRGKTRMFEVRER